MAECPLRQPKAVEDEERCVVNTIPKSTRYKNIRAARIFEISHVSAILGQNPYTGKVELEQETVVMKVRRLQAVS